jgi:hypothetical protein
MTEIGGAEQFRQLSAHEQARYVEHAKKMTTHAMDHAIPIVIAPPVSLGGTINNGTGFVVQLGSGFFVVTARHVLAKYEKRLQKGERVNWQVGKLPPFDPLSRIAWCRAKRDMVLLRISESEERDIGPCIRSRPSQWPPPRPQEGQMVLVAGYPGSLREDDSSGTIGAGPTPLCFASETWRRLLQMQDRAQRSHQLRRDSCAPSGYRIGGVSGGPVLLLGAEFPIVGVVTENWYIDEAEMELLEFATLEDVAVKEMD